MNEELRPLTIGDKILAISPILAIGAVIGIMAYLFIPTYLLGEEELTKRINAMDCQELAIYVHTNNEGWFSEKVSSKFRNECLPSFFNKQWGSSEKFYTYFTIATCAELQTWILYQFPYIERATHEYEWRCNK